jgi:hypothetical protein
MTDDIQANELDSPDLEGCERGSAHCHARRSPNQETSRTDEGRIRACHRPAGWGTQHQGEGRCKLHGGNSPTHKKGVERERARAAVVTYGLPKDVDPTTALLEEVQRTAGHVAWLAVKVQGLSEDELVWGVTKETTNWERNPDTEGVQSADSVVERRAEVNAWVKLYQTERAHLARVSAAAIQAGVSERIVNVFRQVGQTYIQLIDRVMEQMDLSDAQRLALPGIMTQELRALMEPDGTYSVEAGE